MHEQDLAVARALAAESRESSPGGSPAPLRKTIITNLADKLNTFRWVGAKPGGGGSVKEGNRLSI